MVVHSQCDPDPLVGENGFESFLAGERARLIRLCAHLTGSSIAAEDLAQETLLEAWRNRRKFSSEDLGDPARRTKWFSAIARNVCLRWGRSSGHDPVRLSTFSLSASSDACQDLDELFSISPTLESELERDELAQLLDRALALLPPVTRAVLVERYVRESSHAEIVERLGLSEDALVQRIYRGKLALRRVLSTELNAEAATYGLVEPRTVVEDLVRSNQETRISCPLCGKRFLVKFFDRSHERIGFTCPACQQICSLPQRSGNELRNPKSILNRLLLRLNEIYWPVINQGMATCYKCGRPAIARICPANEIPPAYSSTHADQSYPGLSIRCEFCQDEEINTLPLLSIDVLESQQFWRRHPRMFWLPPREINYAGQVALLSGFRSLVDSAQLEIIYQPATLKILGIHETTH